MSHKEQIDFFRIAIQQLAQFKGSVIDIGSLNINGGPHALLNAQKYVGVDLESGPNVNLVSPGELISLPSHTFDVAMSSECFEHNPFWKETFAAMCRLTKPGGIVIWSAAGLGRPEHGTTRTDGGAAAPFVVNLGREYYRNVTPTMAKLAVAHDYWFASFKYFYNSTTCDTYFIGIRKNDLGKSQTATVSNIEAFNNLVMFLSKKYSRGFSPLRIALEKFDFRFSRPWVPYLLNRRWAAMRLIYFVYVKFGLKRFRTSK